MEEGSESRGKEVLLSRDELLPTLLVELGRHPIGKEEGTSYFGWQSMER